ncbi:DUF1667 domain-containing protein [Candidatus Bathyarchaeota archaeon]|nr:DUF1667 domain-containing protein [Candidatus Bathyarchaeota archaeon]
MNEEDLICIICPTSCTLRVCKELSGSLRVEGALCPKGVEYAIREVNDPRRVVISVVKVVGGDLPTVSVKTSKPVPKKCIPEIMKATASIELKAPVEIGQVVIRDICGVDVIATRRVKKVNSIYLFKL